MRPRWRKTFLDLVDNRLRTALVVFSIAVGVFSIGVISGTYVILSEDMSASYASHNPMNIEVRADDFDNDLVTTIQGMPGIAEAEGRRVFTIRARAIGGGQWTAINMMAIDDFKKVHINLLKPLLGEARPGKKQVLLEKKAFTELKAAPGAEVEFQLPDGTIKRMPVAGVVEDPTTGAGDFLASPYMYITTDTLATLQQPDLFNRMFVTVSSGQNDREHIRNVAGSVKDKIEKTDITVNRTNIAKSSEHPLANTIQAILGILLALGILILFLSSSLIANTISALLNQHLRHIGVMKLVGARRNQILTMYLVLIMAFSLIALLMAVPLGGQGAYALSAFAAEKLNFSLLGYRIVPLALVIQVIVGLAVPLLAGLGPVVTGSRVTVLKAISGETALETDEKPRSGPHREPAFERFEMWAAGALARRGIHIPRPLLISLRNTFRRKGRLMLTLFTLTMGGAIFISVFNVRVTLFDFINTMNNYFRADVTLNFSQPYRLDKVRLAGIKAPHVTGVEGWGAASAEVLYDDKSVADNLIILAPPVDSQLVEWTPVSGRPAGRWLQPGDERAIAVSESILDKFPNLQPGQFLTLKLDGKEAQWKVVGIFKFFSQQGTIAYGTYEFISRLTHQANRSTTYRIVTDQHDGPYQNKMAEELDSYFRKQGFHVSDARGGKASLSTAAESLDILVGFLLIMALLTASVGSMGLAGTMGMNVLERTREIGIMRSIGAVDREIMRTVIVEGVVIGSISWIMAVILSFPFTYLLSTIVSLAIFDSPIDVHFTFVGFLIWLVVVLILSALASVLPARNAARLTIREVLAYE